MLHSEQQGWHGNVLSTSEFKASTDLLNISLADSQTTNAVVNRVALKLRQELSKLHLNGDTPSSTPTFFRTNPLVLGKVVLRPDTKLDKRKVSQ